MGGAVDGLAQAFGAFQPLAGYTVYDVEYSQLMCSRRLLEVCIYFLNEDRLGLGEIKGQQAIQSRNMDLSFSKTRESDRKER